jgi:hypothetical protein
MELTHSKRGMLLRTSLLAATAAIAGCGTTRTTDTGRTATEQLLVSDAIDRAVSDLNVAELAGQSVYFESCYLSDVVDRPYLVSSIRQHLLASGCVLKDDRNDADFIVEARAGAIGTNRHDLLFGIPSTNLPQILPLQGVPAAVPEVPIAKRRDQRGVAKVAVFAYHRESGLPVWQSGIAREESRMNDVWLLGAGPFQHGTLDGDTKNSEGNGGQPVNPLAREATFAEPTQLVEQMRRLPETGHAVAVASHESAAASGSESATDAPFEPDELIPELRPPLPLAARNDDFPVAPAGVSVPAALLERVGPEAGHSGSFYSIERTSLPSNRTVASPRPVDPVPLPSPIVN